MDTYSNRMDTNSNRMDTYRNRLDTYSNRKDTNSNRKDTNSNGKDTNSNRVDTNSNRILNSFNSNCRRRGKGFDCQAGHQLWKANCPTKIYFPEWSEFARSGEMFFLYFWRIKVDNNYRVWHGWQIGCFRHQKARVWVQSSATLSNQTSMLQKSKFLVNDWHHQLRLDFESSSWVWKRLKG